MPIIRATKLGTISRYKGAKVWLSATDARDQCVGDRVVVVIPQDNNTITNTMISGVCGRESNTCRDLCIFLMAYCAKFSSSDYRHQTVSACTWTGDKTWASEHSKECSPSYYRYHNVSRLIQNLQGPRTVMNGKVVGLKWHMKSTRVDGWCVEYDVGRKWLQLYFYENFGKYRAIFVILWRLDALTNCRASWSLTYHLSSNLLPEIYIAKIDQLFKLSCTVVILVVCLMPGGVCLTELCSYIFFAVTSTYFHYFIC